MLFKKEVSTKWTANNDFLLGIFLLSMFYFVMLITSIMFVFKQPISSLQIVFSLVCSAIIIFFLTNNVKKVCTITLFGISIIVLTIFLCNYFHDISFDGNTYHKTITGFMKNGWNPLYVTFYDFAKDFFPFVTSKQTWYDAYPKGSEIWGACIYAITENIESGKNYNLISSLMVFFIGHAFLRSITSLRLWQVKVCAFFLAFHPVILAQMFTYYNDGFMWNIILVCIFACFYLTFSNSSVQEQLVCFGIIFAAINVAFNIKFSAMIFLAFPCISMFVYWWIRKEEYSRKFVYHSFIVFIISVISALTITGSTSYMINVIRHQNPVYTMIGKGSTDIITAQTPLSYKKLSHFERFIGSMFSKTSNNQSISKIEWKIPFTYSQSEINYAKHVDTRIAGWGVLFSGILCLSIVVLVCTYTKWKRKKPRITHIISIFFLVILLNIFFVPGMFWARYSVFFLYIPVCAVLFLFIDYNESCNKHFYKIISAFTISGLLFLNLIPNILWLQKLYKISTRNANEIQQIKNLANISDLDVSFVGTGNTFFGRAFSLYDNGINRFNYRPETAKDYTGIVFSNARPIFYKSNHSLFSAFNLEQYVLEIKRLNNVIVLVAVNDDCSKALTNNMVLSMRRLGLKFDMKGKYRYHYVALIDNNENKVLFEKESRNQVSYNCNVEGHNITMLSTGYYGKEKTIASIVIDDQEYAKNRRGLNIVLYNTEKGIVVDSVFIDSFKDNTVRR